MLNKLINRINKLVNSKLASWFLLIGFFLIVASAVHCGFMAKWGLRDFEGNFSYQYIMDEKASKPFVYRQLLPAIAREAQILISNSNISNETKLYYLNKYNPQKSFSNATSANTPGYEYSYRVIYLLNFFGFLISLFLLRSILLNFNYSHIESILAPSAFLLAFPYLQTVGGYFYDSIELAFFSGAVLLAIQGRLVSLVILAAFATVNKESFFFFLPTLYPILLMKHSKKNALIGLISAILVSGSFNALLKYIYQYNSGGPAEFHLVGNFWMYIYHMATTFTDSEMTYGLPGPRGVFFTTLILIFIIVVRGSAQIPKVIKSHLLIALAINIPLFIVFCAAGELRNLSMLYVGFVILIASLIKVKLQQTQITST